jgi:hypothetical protein
VAQTGLAETSGLMLWTTTEVLLKEHGPLARIWLQGMPPRSQATQSVSSLRQCLFDVIPTYNPNAYHTLVVLASLSEDRRP